MNSRWILLEMLKNLFLKDLNNVASLTKQLKEKEEINNKLKQLAIKAKKELGEKQAKVLEILNYSYSALTVTLLENPSQTKAA